MGDQQRHPVELREVPGELDPQRHRDPDVERRQRLVEQQQPRVGRPAPGRSPPAAPGRRRAAPGRRSARSSTPSRASQARAASLGVPAPRRRGCAGRTRRCPSAVRCGNSRSSWNTMPTGRGAGPRAGPPSPSQVSPSQTTWPVVERHDPGERPHEGGLAGAVGADHGDHVAALGGAGVRRACARAGGRRRARRGRALTGAPAPWTAWSNQRSRSRASTATETSIRITLSTSAASWSALQRDVDRVRHRAGGARVVAGERDRRAELPERPRPRRAPARRAGPGPASGRVTRPEGRPPARAEGRRHDVVLPVGGPQRALDGQHEERQRDEGVRDHDGGGGERAGVIPNASSSGPPTRPRRPNADSSATPPTTGGSTSGTITSARTTDRPGKSTRASDQASGTPTRNTTPRAASEVTSESRSASRIAGLVSWPRKSDPRRAGQQRHHRQRQEHRGDAARAPAAERVPARALRRAAPSRSRLAEAGVGEHLLAPWRESPGRRTPGRAVGFSASVSAAIG